MDLSFPVKAVRDGRHYDDPLDADAVTDAEVRTTRRALIRLALVATETGARFQREGIGHDPMSWLLAPRNLFGGGSAIDACLTLEGCLRGLLVQGLSLGLDADPDIIDGLAPGDAPIRMPPAGGRVAVSPGGGGGGATRAPAAKLFTATIVASRANETLQAFHASVAHGEREVAARLRDRFGPAARHARIAIGFDASDPLAAALVSPAVGDTLTLIAADPASPLAAGLDLNVEQRFAG